MKARKQIARVATVALVGSLSVGLDISPAAAATACPAFTALVTGDFHTAALTATGKVWTWGGNGDGQLGDGTTSSRIWPVEVPGLSGVTAITAGNSNTFALGPGGTVWGWGDNWAGQLGDGTTTTRFKPVQATGLTGVTKIAAGSAHTLVLKSDGTVWSWGYNEEGELGDGTWTSRITPAQVPGLTGIVDIAAGDFHSLAIDAGGTAYVWGYNGYGQLGNGTTSDRSSPEAVTSIRRARGVSGGWVDAFVRTARGDVYAAGENFYGQLGDGTTNDRHTWTQVAVTNATAVEPGWFHSVALRGAGEVWAWGDNTSGGLGDGTTTSRPAPAAVPGLTGATAVGAGDGFSVALLPGGAVKGWGWNSQGSLGTGTTSAAVLTPVSPVCEAPVLTSGSAAPSAVKPGNDVTFTVGWTDGVGESVHAVVCKTAAISTTGTCPGGAWATGSPTSVSPATATYTTTLGDVGTKSWWGFACDATNACSAAASGTFTVVSAQCSDGIDNDGDKLSDYPLDPGCGSELDDDESNVVEAVVSCDHTRQSGVYVVTGEAVVADRPEPTIAIRLTCQLKDVSGAVVAEVTQSASGPAVALAQAIPAPFEEITERCAVALVTYLNRAPATIEKCVTL